ncbi:helix-turn-helix transcriptional regulator [Solwaraspora sp. WMMA2056]|uniref:helix-turn-helix domain-containing protein n=1 Tax=Solwaraspora sp. WMMA2056 TaxID=3015161 RepID=UPI00259BA975|nr:helix-turn-helix transcriptional regulator [Solwaraspora sp. WMMA2056]WJK40482.1 helix-turn-helix transcriptional regulator [Solwaraspora sp. WMMA2056]
MRDLARAASAVDSVGISMAASITAGDSSYGEVAADMAIGNAGKDHEVGMIKSQVIAEARRALGRQLAAYREAAGLIQEQLAPLIHYGRSTIANAETGYSICSRTFWERCDAELNAHGVLLRSYDEFKALTRGQRAAAAEQVKDDRLAKLRRLQDHSSGTSGVGTVGEPSDVPLQRIPEPSSFAESRPDEPWGCLAYFMQHPDQLDEPTVEHLEWYTCEMFRREEHLPSGDLTRHLQAHIMRLNHLLTGPPVRFQRRLLMAAGEALALAGWLAWDLRDFAEADRLLGAASDAAHQAGDGPLLACVLAYRSYAAEADGDTGNARELLVAAQRYARSPESATTRAWLAAREAEINATLTDEMPALRALDRAMTAYDYARPHNERSWTAFLTPTRLGSMSITTHARLDHADLDAVTDSVIASLEATDFKKVIVLADVSAAAIQRGRYDQGAALGHEALDHTGARKTRLISQRVHGLRQLIRDKSDVPALAELDDRLLTHVA